MFTAKKQSLFEKTSAPKPEKSAFVGAALKTSAKTLSGNRALKYNTSGNPFVDQFSFLGSYKEPRAFNLIEKDCEILWSENPHLTIIFMFYIRTINRMTSLMDGTKTEKAQKGGELRHEAIMRMMWLSLKAPDLFYKNIPLFVSIGSWKDIIVMLAYDLIYHGWDGRVLDWKQMGDLLLSGLSSESTSELVKKYLPQIRANNKCTTVESQADNMISKWLCSLIFGSKESSSNYRKYRKLKTSGKAHEWQKLISRGEHNLIDFNTIHGRALSLLVKSKYLKNQGLTDKYTAWVTKPETEVKYTGFVHELFAKLPGSLSGLGKEVQETINKQFNTLVTKTKEQNVTSLIVVRDTSHSMSSIAPGTSMSCYDVGKALALFFSEFLSGVFADAWIEFNSDAKMHKWKGTTPIAKWYNDHSSFVGGTDFMRVIGLFCRLKSEGVHENDFPTGILCISDSEFNPTSCGQTNVDAALIALADAGFSKDYVQNFVIVLWNLQNSYYGKGSGQKFETYGNVPNVFYFGGYSASTISFLTSKIMNAEELFHAAMDQEVLKMIRMD